MAMRSHFLFWMALVAPAYAQTYTRQNIATILGFENNSQAGVFPTGWNGNARAGIVADDQLVRSGKYSTRIDRTASSPPSLSGIAQSIPVDFSGKTIFWRGWIKRQNVGDYVAL